jgi:hypothetical protein
MLLLVTNPIICSYMAPSKEPKRHPWTTRSPSRESAGEQVSPTTHSTAFITSLNEVYVDLVWVRCSFVEGQRLVGKKLPRRKLGRCPSRHHEVRDRPSRPDGGLVFDAGSITLGEYLDRWLNTSVRDTVRRSTYVRYEGFVRNYIKPSIGRMKLKGLSPTRLSPTHVRSLYRKKLDSGLAPRSVNYIHVTLHKALEQAILNGLVPRNVSEGVKVPQVRKEEAKLLSPTQARALLSAASGGRLEALYLLAIHTGLRQGELSGLKWTDVDLELPSIGTEVA